MGRFVCAAVLGGKVVVGSGLRKLPRLCMEMLSGKLVAWICDAVLRQLSDIGVN